MSPAEYDKGERLRESSSVAALLTDHHGLALALVTSSLTSAALMVRSTEQAAQVYDDVRTMSSWTDMEVDAGISAAMREADRIAKATREAFTSYCADLRVDPERVLAAAVRKVAQELAR